jgi:hypothetical protein
MNPQPEEMHLAEALRRAHEELRRLHAVNQDLLEALWGMVTSFHAVEHMEEHMQQSAAKARAAIAKATGEKT